MKIVVDANIPLANEFFSRLGDVTLIPPRELSTDNVKDADVLVVRSVVKIDKHLLENSKVKFVGSCTAGVDHLDTDYMDQNNIVWSGAPGCNANAVVEYVLSALAALSLEKNIDWWNKSVGIIGCGNVGSRLYKRLTAFGLSCQVYDPLLSENACPEKIDDNFTSLENVLSNDIVCVHAPLTHHAVFPSFHLLGEKELSCLPENVILISAGRGAVIDNQALLSFLKGRRDITAVLDVWEDEPLIPDELLHLVNLATPHIAGHSYDGKALGTEIIYNKLCGFLNVSPDVTFSDFDSAPKKIITLTRKHNLNSQINEAILLAHDVRDDDNQLRSELAKIGTEDLEKRKDLFDSLRKNYKKRREFSNCLIELSSNLSAISKPKIDSVVDLATKLQVLGFNIKRIAD
ncbi:MAG: 4-phosphoerythronate dehydrogenase [Cellvibrionaceae bacterium]